MLQTLSVPLGGGAKAPRVRGCSIRAMAAAGVSVKEVPTVKIDGQKTGTSGLRKKAKEFSTGHYLANWVQSLFNALPSDQRVRPALSSARGIAAVGAANGVAKRISSLRGSHSLVRRRRARR